MFFKKKLLLLVVLTCAMLHMLDKRLSCFLNSSGRLLEPNVYA